VAKSRRFGRSSRPKPRVGQGKFGYRFFVAVHE
jgi:hypothetical protein